jgi:hypothetical protein
MRKGLAILALLASPVYGQSTLPDASGALSLQMPQGPQNYQSDRFRAGNLDCANAIGSATNLEFGVMGLVNQGDYYNFNNEPITSPFRDIGVFARVVIPLGQKPRSRIDCNSLFELEMRYRSLEIQRLEAEIVQLRELAFED